MFGVFGGVFFFSPAKFVCLMSQTTARSSDLFFNSCNLSPIYWLRIVYIFVRIFGEVIFSQYALLQSCKMEQSLVFESRLK